MFEAFYSLSHVPFSRDIPTKELYKSVLLEETLGRLEYAAERKCFAVITGDCGTGKTTTIRRYAETLNKAKYKVLYISDSKLTPRHFYKGLLEQLGQESKFYRGDAKRQLHREIELMRGIHNLQPVVVVDEAHLLDREMLEEVRFMNDRLNRRPSLKDYFIQTGFYDLFPLAMQLAKDMGYEQNEMIEAICKVNDKFFQYPPKKNRTAWFKTVFQEKLQEARGDILAFKATRKFRRDA